VLDELFRSGRAIDIVMAVMLVEALVLVARKRSDPLSILLALLPGMLILVALRLAITGSGWPVVAAVLLLSWPVHLADIARRRW
jgi:hypothetical protein